MKEHKILVCRTCGCRIVVGGLNHIDGRQVCAECIYRAIDLCKINIRRFKKKV